LYSKDLVTIAWRVQFSEISLYHLNSESIGSQIIHTIDSNYTHKIFAGLPIIQGLGFRGVKISGTKF
jgi:hypothetical protein